MKKEFVEPEVEVIEIGADVITTSDNCDCGNETMEMPA